MSRILVVDDNKRIREIVRFSLEKNGHNVDEAADGESAVDLLTENSYDLYVLDVMLPGVTGFEIAEKVRGLNETAKIIMLSAISQGTQISDDEMKTKSGADAFISKPFKIADFMKKVELLLE